MQNLERINTETRGGVWLAASALMLLGAGIALGIAWSQNRCYRRYQRLCHKWFAGDPDGELSCLERAEDVCY